MTTSHLSRTDSLTERPTSCLGELLSAAESLVLFEAVLDDPVSRRLVELLRGLRDQATADALRLSYGQLFRLLAEERELDPAGLAGNAWQAHLLRRLLEDENPFSRKAQLAPIGAMGSGLLEQAS